MASEILSNLQLGSLILNGSKTNTLSASSGALISAPAVTVTDSTTAASGTLTQFNAHYLAAPTLAATNTSVTTTTANTLTIAGAPAAGTNETLTAAYALNILQGPMKTLGSIYEANYFCATWLQTASQAFTTSSLTPASSFWLFSSAASNLPTSISASTLMNSSGVVTVPFKSLVHINMITDTAWSSSSTQQWCTVSTTGGREAAYSGSAGQYTVVGSHGHLVMQSGDTITPSYNFGTAGTQSAQSGGNGNWKLSISFKPCL